MEPPTQKPTDNPVNYVRTWSNYVWHPQKSREILEYFIVPSVAKDRLVLSQYDLHRGGFLLVTPIVTSSYREALKGHANQSSFPCPMPTTRLCPPT